MCPFHTSSETMLSNLIYRGKGQKQQMTRNKSLNKDSFLFGQGGIIQRASQHAICIFPSSFPKYFLKTKRKTSCLAGSCAVTNKRHFNHGNVLSVFYQVLSFTPAQLGSSMFYVKSLEKAGFKL